jgi:hypothetical protein
LAIYKTYNLKIDQLALKQQRISQLVVKLMFDRLLVFPYNLINDYTKLTKSLL